MLAPSEDTATDSDCRQYSVNRPATASTIAAVRQAVRARVRAVPGVRTAAWVVTSAKTTVRTDLERPGARGPPGNEAGERGPRPAVAATVSSPR
jgi:hypothetical protein